jgi:putative phosphoserine phosphatase / 1-acylglycerol-3-phosphate O-acyltransferase
VDPEAAVRVEPWVRPFTLGDCLRTLITLAVILPGLVLALLTLLVGGTRRLAFNRATEFWGRAGLRAAGVELRIEGGEFLDTRPAVFVINHQSGIDPILVCALLKRDFVGVAKAELRRNILLGPAFAAAGTIFLDRAKGDSAKKNLLAAVDILEEGYGVAIAPEGTRSAESRVGAFKAGAFRLAGEVKIPIVPIVIHDAGQILPRGGFIMRSGRVHVSVLPPVETSGWAAGDARLQASRFERLFESVLQDARSPDRS